MSIDTKDIDEAPQQISPQKMWENLLKANKARKENASNISQISQEENNTFEPINILSTLTNKNRFAVYYKFEKGINAFTEKELYPILKDSPIFEELVNTIDKYGTEISYEETLKKLKSLISNIFGLKQMNLPDDHFLYRDSTSQEVVKNQTVSRDELKEKMLHTYFDLYKETFKTQNNLLSTLQTPTTGLHPDKNISDKQKQYALNITTLLLIKKASKQQEKTNKAQHQRSRAA